jgi:hypothetical protein
VFSRSVESRKCLYFNVCGRTETYTGRWKEHWHPYQDGYLCKTHYSKLVGYKKRTAEQRKKYNDKYNIRKIKFIDRQIIVSKNPKSGFCSWCSNNIYDGSCKVTNMHHVEYDKNNVLANTIEICASCHAYETTRLRMLKKRMVREKCRSTYTP